MILPNLTNSNNVMRISIQTASPQCLLSLLQWPWGISPLQVLAKMRELYSAISQALPNEKAPPILPARSPAQYNLRRQGDGGSPSFRWKREALAESCKGEDQEPRGYGSCQCSRARFPGLCTCLTEGLRAPIDCRWNREGVLVSCT